MSIALILLAIACSAVWILAFLRSLCEGRTILALVLGLSALHEMSLVSLPVVASVLTGLEFEREMANCPSAIALVEVMLGELLFLWVLIIVLHLACGSSRGRADAKVSQPQKAVLLAIAMLGIIATWRAISNPVASVAESVLHAEVRTDGNIAAMLSDWVISPMLVPSVAAGAVLLTSPRSSTLGRLVGSIVLASFAVMGLVTGVRGRITWALFPLLTCALIWKRRSMIRIALLGFPVAAALFGVIGEDSFRWRVMSEIHGQSQWEVVGIVLHELEQPGEHMGVGALAESLIYRAMGPRNSTVLYQMHDEGDAAGGQILWSALVFPVPRLFWPDKPPAGSRDSSPYSGAEYEVMSRGQSAPFYTMGPYLASAHAYWEGGNVWLVFEAALCGLAWGWVVRWTERMPKEVGIFYVFMFLGAFLLDGLYTANAPLYTLIRVTWLSALPALALFGFADFFTRGSLLPFPFPSKI